MNNPILAYKTESIAELEAYRDRIGHDVWRDMEVKVFQALEVLQPGRFYDVSRQVKEEQQELFVKCCCVYILEQTADCLHPVYFLDGNIIKKY